MALVRSLRPLGLLAVVAAASTPAAHAQGAAASRRAMTWLDMQHMRTASAPALSADGKWMLYTVNAPDWREASTQSDIYLVSAERGAASTRQLTFTRKKNETQPRWAPDGTWFVFSSNRDAAPASGSSGAGSTGSGGGSSNQLYLMRPDGGEARQITTATPGVTSFDFSRDGRWLVYRAGRPGAEQLHALPVADLAAASPHARPELDEHRRTVGGPGRLQRRPRPRTGTHRVEFGRLLELVPRLPRPQRDPLAAHHLHVPPAHP